MTSSNALRAMPRLIVGVTILLIGILWTLDNVGYINSEPIARFWPLAIIAIGAMRLSDPAASRSKTILILFIGVMLLLGSLDLLDWDLGDLIPLGIALIGGKIAWDALRRRKEPVPVGDAGATITAFAMMAGIHRQSTSQSFRGGDANAIMGGVEIDLRNAQIEEGQNAVIDAFAMWGGVEITVPPNWRVIGEVMPLLGAFDDKTISKPGSGPTLIVRGVALMGGVVVQNAKDASDTR